MSHQTIASLKEGDYICSDKYVVTEIKPGICKNGNPFVSMTLSDSTGRIKCRIFNTTILTPKDNGSIVLVNDLTCTVYQETPQLQGDANKGADINIVPFTALDCTMKRMLSRLETDNPEELIVKIEKTIDSIHDSEYRELTLQLWRENKDALSQIPAGIKVHHSGVHGLLVHICEMLDIGFFMARMYRWMLDSDLLIAGIILHDLGKVKEFNISPLGMVSEYSLDGCMATHLTMGSEMIAFKAKELSISPEKTRLLQNMVLSHHYKPEWKAATPVATIEAYALYICDNVSSQMNMFRHLTDEVDPYCWSDYITAEVPRLYNHGALINHAVLGDIF